jgi:hypothetical protein
VKRYRVTFMTHKVLITPLAARLFVPLPSVQATTNDQMNRRLRRQVPVRKNKGG